MKAEIAEELLSQLLEMQFSALNVNPQTFLVLKCSGIAFRSGRQIIMDVANAIAKQNDCSVLVLPEGFDLETVDEATMNAAGLFRAKCQYAKDATDGGGNPGYQYMPGALRSERKELSPEAQAYLSQMASMPPRECSQEDDPVIVEAKVDCYHSPEVFIEDITNGMGICNSVRISYRCKKCRCPMSEKQFEEWNRHGGYV